VASSFCGLDSVIFAGDPSAESGGLAVAKNRSAASENGNKLEGDLSASGKSMAVAILRAVIARGIEMNSRTSALFCSQNLIEKVIIESKSNIFGFGFTCRFEGKGLDWDL